MGPSLLLLLWALAAVRGQVSQLGVDLGELAFPKMTSSIVDWRLPAAFLGNLATVASK